ncbi:MAG: sigma-70 family RNA polymerase sigma factor [Chthonomonadales bacterium]|nr:sigma-70 family RNA polymerase sigma factor [Chthonomonadales bacterium]
MPDLPPGDAHANRSFDALVAAYEKKIFNLVYRFLGDHEEAADITQETFISAYRAYRGFRGESQVYTWLYQIAVNHCRNRLRQRGRTRSLHMQSLDEPPAWDEGGPTSGREIADLSQAPHTVLEAKETRARILAAVETLPPEYREVVVLREMNGLAYNDIAATTGLTIDNVKTRLSRARAMLRRKLGPDL